MPGTDAEVTGANLAIAHGVATGIAMVQQELALIGQAVAGSAAMIDIAARLGARMLEMSTDAAPLNVPATPDGPVILSPTTSATGREPQVRRPNKSASTHSKTAPSRSTDRLHSIARPYRNLASSTTRHWSSKDPGVARSQDQETGSLTDNSLQNLKSAITVTPAGQPIAVSPSNNFYRFDIPAVAPAALPPVVSSPTYGFQYEQPVGDEIVTELPPQADIRSPSRTDSLPDRAQYRIATDSVAPNEQRAKSVRESKGETASRRNTMAYAWSFPNSAAEESAETSAVRATPTAGQELPTVSGSRQGMLILDGAQLGRWVIDHLETTASRPGSGTSGIDPRMTATYPGAPSGA
jgi:hypothetical protein